MENVGAVKELCKLTVCLLSDSFVCSPFKDRSHIVPLTQKNPK